MTKSHIDRRWAQNERGGVLIQVAVALLALLALSSFVFDYGVMWASRGQAQNSADAGALAGAISLAFDSGTDQDGARAKAIALARRNQVWTQAPDITNADVTFPPCPPGAPGLPDTCIKVDVFRNQRPGGNPLPVFFSRLVGITDQGVRATATAQIITGDTTDCLKPWAILDRWDEYNTATNGAEAEYPNPDPDFLPSSTFDRYSTGQGSQPPQENDLYVRPTPGPSGSPGTGFRLPQDEGRQFGIKVDSNTSSTVSPGWFRAIRLPRLDGQNGGDVYRENITSCGGLPSSYAAPDTVCPTNIGNDDMAYWAARGCYATEPGNKVGPSRQGIEELLARDAGAYWGANGITGSRFSPGTSSPRVVPIGVIDIDDFLSQDPSGANGVLRMVNIYGFFIEGMGDVDEVTGQMTLKASGKSVIGRIMTIPSMATGSSSLPNSASFLRSIILVR
jgi:Putative Flp pilus-assembly TadE/G-like